MYPSEMSKSTQDVPESREMNRLQYSNDRNKRSLTVIKKTRFEKEKCLNKANYTSLRLDTSKSIDNPRPAENFIIVDIWLKNRRVKVLKDDESNTNIVSSNVFRRYLRCLD